MINCLISVNTYDLTNDVKIIWREYIPEENLDEYWNIKYEGEEEFFKRTNILLIHTKNKYKNNSFIRSLK